MPGTLAGCTPESICGRNLLNVSLDDPDALAMLAGKGNEVKEWLRENAPRNANGCRYVILDDVPDFLPEQRDWFVQVNPEVGITERDVERAVKLLNQCETIKSMTMAQQKRKDSFRGDRIPAEFAKQFRESKFYTEVYQKHLDEVIIGVRDGYVNLYYNCDSIAKISALSRTLTAEISSYYVGKDKGKTYHLSADELAERYDEIKAKSDSHPKDKSEKQAQERLFIDNNSNPESEWFCIDVEYTKAFKGKSAPESWRFDIIAITKEAPHKVALIELKYGSKAIGGNCGIQKHIRDYADFHRDGSFHILKPEIVSIVKGLALLGVDVPASLRDIEEDKIDEAPEYCFITLNNNPSGRNGSTPEQTMGGYLFAKDGDSHPWGSKRVSDSVAKNGYCKATAGLTDFKPRFLFSTAQLPDLNIPAILDERYYTKREV